MKSKIRAGWLGVAGFAVIAGAGCGSDGDGDGSKSSGVSGSKPLSGLSEEEATKLCEWGTEFGDDLTKKQVCTFLGQFANTPAECEASVAECMKGDLVVEDEEGDCENAKDEFPASCSATVSELEACLVDQTAVLTGASCANAGKLDAAPTPPASCQTVEQKCPTAFEDDDNDGDDFEDDEDISSGGGLFECVDGSWSLSEDLVCDGEDDCDDGSDEANCN